MIDRLRTPAIDIPAHATPRTHWTRVDANVSKKSGRAISGQKPRLWPLFAITAITTIVFVLTGTSAQAQKKYDPGANDAEIKIGQTMPYSGPVSAFSSVARVHQAYYKMINDHGGINGRKITMISLDDGYNPAKTVEQTRRLVEQDEVLALFSSLGTPTGVAARKYLNDKKVPQLLVLSTSSQWNRPREYPYSTSLNLSADQEAEAIGRFILSRKPDAKIGVLYQNDDYGKDYLKGLKEGLGSKADSMIVSALSYLSSDPTLDQQLVALKYSGADVFVNATTGKFSAMSIRKAGELKWKPLQIASTSNLSLKNVLLPAGVENAEGIISLVNYKDPSDPKIANDPGCVKTPSML
jgi:branched-chain amino acid transport system substrate-binding protein